MVSNGFVQAIKNDEIRQKRTRAKEKQAYKNLVQLFKKYNVDFTKNFSVNNWNKTDKALFVKSMVQYGYAGLINKYVK